MNAPVLWLAVRAAAVPEGDAWLGEAERAVQSKLRFAPRRASWRLGRWAAKRALGQVLGHLPMVTVGGIDDDHSVAPVGGHRHRAGRGRGLVVGMGVDEDDGAHPVILRYAVRSGRAAYSTA